MLHITQSYHLQIRDNCSHKSYLTQLKFSFDVHTFQDFYPFMLGLGMSVCIVSAIFVAV